MIPWKEIPVAVTPHAFFLVALETFGELYQRIPADDWLALVIKDAMGISMISSAILFFTRCIFRWPKLFGLDPS